MSIYLAMPFLLVGKFIKATKPLEKKFAYIYKQSMMCFINNKTIFSYKQMIDTARRFIFVSILNVQYSDNDEMQMRIS